MSNFSIFRPSTWFAGPSTEAAPASGDDFFSSPTELSSWDDSDLDSYEPAEEPGRLSSFWDGASSAWGFGVDFLEDSWQQGKSSLEDGFDAASDWWKPVELTTETLDQAEAAFDNAWESATTRVETGWDAAADSVQDFWSDSVELASDLKHDTFGALEHRKEALLTSYESFEESAKQAFDFARDVGESWLDEAQESAIEVKERALEHGERLFEARVAMFEAEHPVAFELAELGFDLARGATEAGELVWDLHREDPATFRERMLASGLDEIEAELHATEHGQRFSGALDLGIWAYQSAKASGTFAQDLAEGLSEGAAPALEGLKRRTFKETLGLGYDGPVLYGSQVAADAIEKAREGEYSLLGGLDEARSTAARTVAEYASWYAQGNSPLESTILTAVGDDWIVTDEELAANHDQKDPLQGLVPTFYDPRKKEASTDPNRSYFVNGILNDFERARWNAGLLAPLADRPIVGLHNPTTNPVSDLAQAQLVNKLDLADTTTQMLVQAVREQVHEEGRTEPIRLYLHSQGGAIGAAAVHHLTLEERAQVELMTFGAAAYRYPEGLHSVTAYVNVQDMVPGLVGAGVALLDRTQNYRNDNYNVYYLDFGEPGIWETSHNLDGYVNAIRGDSPSDSWRELPSTRWEATIRRILGGTS